MPFLNVPKIIPETSTTFTGKNCPAFVTSDLHMITHDNGIEMVLEVEWIYAGHQPVLMEVLEGSISDWSPR